VIVSVRPHYRWIAKEEWDPYAAMRRLIARLTNQLARRYDFTIRPDQWRDIATRLLSVPHVVEDDVVHALAPLLSAVTEHATEVVGEALSEATDAAARQELEALQRKFGRGMGAAFGPVSDLSLVAVSKQAARLVRHLESTDREALSLVITRGLEGGKHPYELMDDVRALVGLDPRYAVAVCNYENRLIARGLDRQVIREKVEAYAEKLRQLRAENIARTELITAANEARRSAWKVAEGEGLLPEFCIRRWVITPDDRLCPACMAMEGRKATIRGTYPGGVSGPPLHPGSCRCVEVLEEVDEEEYREVEGAAEEQEAAVYEALPPLRPANLDELAEGMTGRPEIEYHATRDAGIYTEPLVNKARVAVAKEILGDEALKQKFRDGMIRSGLWAKGTPVTTNSVARALNGWYDQWAGWSVNPRSLSLQRAVNRLFGLGVPDTLDGFHIDPADLWRWEECRRLDEAGLAAASEAVAEATYRVTQRKLREMGISEVTLFRGTKSEERTKLSPLSEAKVGSRPLSSWSADPTLAMSFAGNFEHSAVLVTRVPAERVWSMWSGSGWGYESGCESEFVLIGPRSGSFDRALAIRGDLANKDEDWVRLVRRRKAGEGRALG